MICFDQKCPHCSARERVELDDDLALPTQREREATPAIQADPIDNYLTSNCGECGATFVVDFLVRERPYVSVLSRAELVAVTGRVGRRELEDNCAGCGRSFEEAQRVKGRRVCVVCNQEATRILGRAS